jgi:hypothetical protein
MMDGLVFLLPRHNVVPKTHANKFLGALLCIWPLVCLRKKTAAGTAISWSRAQWARWGPLKNLAFTVVALKVLLL